MTDDELLEYAAKAIGVKPDEWASNGTAFFGNAPWNPLTGDGDAFRLAVKLNLCIEFHQGIKLRVSACHKIENGTRCVYVECDGDDLNATRQAIVLAATEIGKDMP